MIKRRIYNRLKNFRLAWFRKQSPVGTNRMHFCAVWKIAIVIIATPFANCVPSKHDLNSGQRNFFNYPLLRVTRTFDPSDQPRNPNKQYNVALPLGKTNRIDYASFTFQLLRIRIEKRAKTRRALFLSLFLKRLKLLTYRIDASRTEDWKRSARFYGRIRKVTRHVSFANLITIELAYIRFCYAERIKTSVKYIYIYIYIGNAS